MNGLRVAMRTLWMAVALASVAGAAAAVVLDDENLVTVALDDGTQVTLIGVANTSTGAAPAGADFDLPAAVRRTVGGTDSPLGGAAAATPAAAAGSKVERLRAVARLPMTKYTRTQQYYYLPPGLHLSKRPDGTPEFLFLKFTTEEREASGGASGALLHFLVEWGLTPDQEREVQTKLRAKVPNAQLMGAVPMEPDGEAGTFEVVSASLSDRAMAPSVVTSGKAPLVPGGKAAVAARLSANGAQLLAATFEKARSITDVTLTLDLAYTTITPAAKGSITFDWSKLETERESLKAEYERKYSDESVHYDCFLIFCVWGDDEHYEYSYEELREHYKFMEEKQVIHLEWLETRNDEKLNKIREAFFDYFVQSMTSQTQPDSVAPPKDKPEAAAAPQPPGDASKYHYNRQSVEAAMKRKISFFDLNVRLPVKHPIQVVGNLGSWYKAVENNPKCVAEVSLNDPFFQHRDIHFILDLDAKEMFDEAVNYVTVNVRKKRDSGAPFQDHVTMDSRYVKDNGIRASMTYSRGNDANPDVYEYQSQWSLRGGQVFPPSPPWQRGSWEGVTLAPPVVPRMLEVEGSLEDMAANDVARITVQVHYAKFGAEAEDNIHVSPVQGQALVSKRIFLDRDAKGYVYRLIVNHKTKGKLVLPWQPRVGDDYIYASLPQELFQEGSTVHTAAVEAARDVANSARDKVLDRFKEVLGTSNPGGGR